LSFFVGILSSIVRSQLGHGSVIPGVVEGYRVFKVGEGVRIEKGLYLEFIDR